MLHNTHSKMTVSTFHPKLSSTLSLQELPEAHPCATNLPLNGAGIVTIINVKKTGEQLVLASGKLNPCHGNFENSLALGGGFKFLEGGIEKNTFASAITASIKFKAPAYPSMEEGRVASVALVGYCQAWGNMQYATLHRVIDVETVEDAIEMVKKINEQNKTLGKADVFGLYTLADVLKSAELTHQLPEDNKAKGDAIAAAGLVVTDLVSGEQRARFIIFDDLATAALDKLIIKPKAALDKSASALNSGLSLLASSTQLPSSLDETAKVSFAPTGTL